MTMAVCFRCGETKFGAFCPCPRCHAMPQNEEDLALSMAMTDHYFNLPTLKLMGAKIRSGKAIHLEPETHARLIADIRSSGLVAQMQDASQQLGAPDATTAAPPKKPWWKFW